MNDEPLHKFLEDLVSECVSEVVKLYYKGMFHP